MQDHLRERKEKYGANPQQEERDDYQEGKDDFSSARTRPVLRLFQYLAQFEEDNQEFLGNSLLRSGRILQKAEIDVSNALLPLGFYFFSNREIRKAALLGQIKH